MTRLSFPSAPLRGCVKQEINAGGTEMSCSPQNFQRLYTHVFLTTLLQFVALFRFYLQ